MSGSLRDLVEQTLGKAPPAPPPTPPGASVEKAVNAAVRKTVEAEAAKQTVSGKADLNAITMATVAASVQLLAREIDSLRAQFAEATASPLGYAGTWEASKSYRKGLFVTFAGSVWHCNEPTSSKPGDGPAWTLAVKRGADAR